MAELKFENESGTSQNVATDLKGLSEKVDQAIDAAINTAVENSSGSSGPAAFSSQSGGGSTGQEAQRSSFYDETLSSLGGRGTKFGTAVSIGLSVHAEVAGGQKHSSFFPAGATQTATKSNPSQQPSRFMPSTYGERVQAAKRPVVHAAKDIMGRPKNPHRHHHSDLVARAGIASKSLTGKSDAHAKASLIKGLKSNPQAAANLGLIPQYLIDVHGDLRRAQTSPMSTQRLLSGLANGNADAENELEHMGAQNKKDLVAGASATAPKLQIAGKH
jgi:hypothetical protein